MKSLPLIVLLAAVTTAAVISNDEAEAPGMVVTSKDVDVTDLKENVQSTLVASKSNLSLGKIGKEDKLMAKAIHIKNATATVVHVQDITVRGNSSTKITAIRVTEVGDSQNGIPSIKEGGIGKDFVVIRLQSTRGRGYHYKTEVWGRETT